MHFDDPAFWRAGAISTIAVMSIVLIMLTIDTLAAIRTPCRSKWDWNSWSLLKVDNHQPSKNDRDSDSVGTRVRAIGDIERPRIEADLLHAVLSDRRLVC